MLHIGLRNLLYSFPHGSGAAYIQISCSHSGINLPVLNQNSLKSNILMGFGSDLQWSFSFNSSLLFAFMPLRVQYNSTTMYCDKGSTQFMLWSVFQMFVNNFLIPDLHLLFLFFFFSFMLIGWLFYLKFSGIIVP